MSFSKLTLQIKAKTWNKNSHGLFDYETRDYNAQSLDLSQSATISRSGTKLACAPISDSKRRETEQSPPDKEILATVRECSEGILISSSCKEEEGLNQFWHAIDKNWDKGYLLKIGDVIRFGRTVAKVRQIKMQEELVPGLSYQNSVFKSIAQHNEDRRQSRSFSSAKESSTQGIICKICLGEKTEDDDPLITPCHCAGSMKYVHYKCLQNWMRSKLNMQKNENIININWQRLHCELCKADLELIIEHEGKELLLIPCSDEMLTSYALIEFFSKDSTPTGMYVIGLSKKARFKIGRGQDCDFNTRDISVSRVHAYLESNNGKLYLRDNSSRFGTLVLMREPLLLSHNSSESPMIQCGRTCFRLTLYKPWASFIPCFGSLFGQSRASDFRSYRPGKLSLMGQGSEENLSDDEEEQISKNQEKERRTGV